MPPFPTRSRPASNCGFTSTTAAKAEAKVAITARQHLLERDERDIGRQQVGRIGQLVGGQVAGVDPFHDVHPGVAPEPLVQLAVAHVESDDLDRAALQQAVDEPAGRSAHVEGAAAGHVEVEGIEGVRQLLPRAGDETGPLAQSQVGIDGDRRAGLVDHYARHLDLAGHDQRSGETARGREASVDKQLVEPHPGDLGHRRALRDPAGRHQLQQPSRRPPSR